MNENEIFDQIPSQEPEQPQTPEVPLYEQSAEALFAETFAPKQPEEPVKEVPVYHAPIYSQPAQEAPRYAEPPRYTQPPYYAEPPRNAEPPKKKKKRVGLLIAVIAIALCCGLLGSICGGAIVGLAMENLMGDNYKPDVQVEQPTTGNTAPTQESTPAQTAPSTLPSATPTPEGFLTPAQVYAYNVSTVVGISNESTTYNVFGQASATASSGSGFIISADGEILTNYHVIEGAQNLTVTLYDGSEYPATVLGYEASSDVALIKIDAKNLTPATLGKSSDLYVGAEVAAIGNPLGELTYSLNVGYISSMERLISTDGKAINMMQLDVSINPGNSGGPLFDMHGNVVGINTAKYSGSSGSGTSIEGIGFAIPIDDVKAILDDLREDGAVLDRAYIGIATSSVTASEAQRFNLPYGVYVESVEKGSCGETAGLQKGDIITAIDSYTIDGYEALTTTLKKYRAGDSATLTVYRSGQTLQLEIVFDARPNTEVQEEATQPTTQFDPWEWFFGG